MFSYYMLDFEYRASRKPACIQGGGITVCFSDDSESLEANQALSRAEKVVEARALIAKQSGIEMIHGYSWPDGSLYKYIRLETQKGIEDDHRKLRKIFDLKATVDGEEVNLRISNIHAEENPQSLNIVDYLTLEESFHFHGRRKENWALYDQRTEEKEALYQEYHLARQVCQVCRPKNPNIGEMACQACMVVLNKAEITEKEWRKKLRPLQP